MFQLSDIFKGGFNFLGSNQPPALEDKLSNQNLPLEEFLKDEEAISTTKFMGKNTKKYLNSEKIKKLIKLITEEPKEDDHLRGHKFPYVAYEILKLDCPFIAKRFVLNDQEYHEEYPDSPDEELDDLELDLDNENENKEIDFDFRDKKIEFDKIYAQIEQRFRDIKKSINMDKEKIRSKDDDYKDEYKYGNNEDGNYEEDYEEFEDNKEDNIESNENKDSINNNIDNNKENEIKHNKEEENNNNIEEKNIENENNDNNNEEEKKDKNNENKDNKNKIEDKENEKEEENNIINKEKKDKNQIEDNKENILIEDNIISDKNNENKEEINEDNVENKKTEDIITEINCGEKNLEDNKKEEVIEDKNKDIKDEDKKEEINILNEEEKKADKAQEILEDKKEEIIEDKKEEIKEEIKEDKNQEINENKKEDIKENDKKEEINMEEKNSEDDKKEIKEETKEEKNEDKKEEVKEETKEEIIEDKKEEVKEETKGEKNEEIKVDEKEEIKEEKNIDNIDNINETDKEEKNENDNQEIKVEQKEKKEDLKDKNNEKIESINQELNDIKEPKQEKENNEQDINGKEEDIIPEKEESSKDNQVIKDSEKKIEILPNEKEEEKNIYSNQENENKKISYDKEEEKGENKNKINDSEINQEEEQNEEINNIIIDTNEEEKDISKNKNKNIDTIEHIENDQENSLSVEGELDDDIPKKNNKKKKVYKNSQNNEYLDLLLNFVMTDKPELNYVLSGYFANVMLKLLNSYPYKIIKYLYTQRRDALKKIIFHSNQKAFSILSSKLLGIESYIKLPPDTNQEMNIFIVENIPYRNTLIKEIFSSINLDGLIIESAPDKQRYGIDIEGIFSLIFGLIEENTLMAKDLIENNCFNPHLFDILDTDLYSDLDNNKNFDTRYNIYCLFVNLTSKFIKIINTKDPEILPKNFDFQSLFKPKEELSFNDNIIISFGKILKNNFLPKKINNISYEGLGSLNLYIFDLVKNMFLFMNALPNQFDSLLIRNNFCKRSVEYLFKYQWNNLYHNKFVDFFNLYLENAEKHNELTDYYFNNIKLPNLLTDYLEEKSEEDIYYKFKSGNKIKSGIYPHIIDLMYKIQAYSDLEIFDEKEKSQLNIINYGEFEFSKDEKSNKSLLKLKISNDIKNILSSNEKWKEVFKNIVIPIIRKYEGKLCKKPKIIEEDDIDTKSDFGLNNLPLQQMLNMLKKTTAIKRSIPLSRNDKSTGPSSLNKKGEKFSIREKLLNKGYRNRQIFDDNDDDDDNKNKKDDLIKNDINNKEEIDDNVDGINEKDSKMFNDSNYWELKNDLPENIKKEVDRKTNIIFNYNPITGENDKKNEISEEDELLSIAMGLEQNEKIEKNKKIMYIMPGRLKPINLKTKSNPVQNIFINISNSKNNNKFEKIKNKKKDIINFFDNENENEEKEHEEENVIKKEEENASNQEKEKDDKMFNEVNYWKSNDNYLNEEEINSLINDL